jgi:hypothetical protein
MSRCVLSTCTPQRTAAQETPARSGRYWPCTHAPRYMPASRFRYSPNARPRPCRDACLARAPHSAPPHRRRLHVQAGTGLAPTLTNKMPASRFRYSPNARPRPCRDACLARAPHSAPPHRRRLHVQAGTGLAPTPPDICLHHDSDTVRMLVRDHVVAGSAAAAAEAETAAAAAAVAGSTADSAAAAAGLWTGVGNPAAARACTRTAPSAVDSASSNRCFSVLLYSRDSAPKPSRCRTCSLSSLSAELE